MSLAPGTRLGPYEIVSALGSGGMGEVYRARDTRLERDVAIKILPAEFCNDPVRRQRFEREAKTISSLNHPHICVLHDVGSQGGSSYLVLECLDGETLAKRLEKGALPLEQALKYGAQIADALDKAHRSGVVHRDLKPGNIMLTAAGAKLLDFGLAKPTMPLATASTLIASAAPSWHTEEGMVVGTFPYMSPEQVEGKELDGRSDIFSLGAVLYEMVTGKRAFEGKSHLSVASAILEREPVPISSIWPLTPPGLDHAIRRCLAKDADERWQTGRDLGQELKWIGESGWQTAGQAAVGTGRSRRDRAAWAVAVMGGVVCVVVLAAYLRLTSVHPQLVIASVVPPAGARFDGAPKISPDGRDLLLALSDAQGKSQLWIRSLDSTTARPLNGTEAPVGQFWSADSRSIGLFANGKLKTVQAAGGPVLTLCDAPAAAGGSWNARGEIVLVPQLGGGIYKIPAGGGSLTLVLDLDKTKFDAFLSPDFLPDGKHFTYIAHGLDAANSGTYFASTDGRENKRILRTAGNRAFASGYLFFPQQSGSSADLMAVALDTATGTVKGEPKVVAHGIEYISAWDEAPFAVSDRALIYQTSPTGTVAMNKLAWIDRSGKKISEIDGGKNPTDLRLSPDAKKVAYARDESNSESINSDIWIQELKTDVTTRLTFDTTVDKGAPVWSPDGSEVLFYIGRGGKTPAGVYRKAANGTGNGELIAPPKDPDSMLWPTDWSRDGRFILCAHGDLVTGNREEVWVLSVAGDRKPRVLVRAPGAVYDGKFSPDGRWVAYVSAESGREDVYVVPFDGSQVTNTAPFEQMPSKKRWQISANGGASPRWRADGKELFYVSPTGDFTRVGVGSKGGEFLSTEARTLFREAVLGAAFPYDVSPDGQRFLVNTPAETGPALPLTLVVNWMELLRNK